MQCMWKIKTKVLSIIIGVNRTISISFRKYLINVTEKCEIRELQKTAILGAAHTHTHTQTHTHTKVIMSKQERLDMGNNITCTMKCNCSIAAKLYALET